VKFRIGYWIKLHCEMECKDEANSSEALS